MGGSLTIQNNTKELKEIIAEEIQELSNDETWNLVYNLYKTDQQYPVGMSPAETLIFKCIFQRLHPRVVIVSSTQYGKTITVAHAILLRITTFPEDWLVTVPDTKRGRLLINYMIKATAENQYFKTKLTGVRNKNRDALNRLLEEKSKVKLTYQVLSEDNVPRYGSIEIVSCEAHRITEAINAVMGFGGRNVVSDESSLISDEIESGVFRMLAGKGTDTCYIKIGNPFARNHFFRSFKDPLYKKIFIDRNIGLADGRYNAPFLDEAKSRPMYSVLFDCKFPDEEAVDTLGYSQLLLEQDLEKTIVAAVQIFGELRLGIDIAGEGKDYSVIMLRGANAARVLWKQKTTDTMKVVQRAVGFIQEHTINPKNVFVEATAIGKGVYDRLKEIYPKGIVAVKGANSPEDSKNSKDYANHRTQYNWRFAQWIKQGNKLEAHSDWEEALTLKYTTEGKKIQMMSKKKMRELRIKSPDVWDAGAVTFARTAIAREEKSEGEIAFNQAMKKRQRGRYKSFRQVPY